MGAAIPSFRADAVHGIHCGYVPTLDDYGEHHHTSYGHEGQGENPPVDRSLLSKTLQPQGSQPIGHGDGDDP